MVYGVRGIGQKLLRQKPITKKLTAMSVIGFMVAHQK